MSRGCDSYCTHLKGFSLSAQMSSIHFPVLCIVGRSGSRKPASAEASCPLSKLFEEPEKPPPTGRPPAPPRAAPREDPLTPR